MNTHQPKKRMNIYLFFTFMFTAFSASAQVLFTKADYLTGGYSNSMTVSDFNNDGHPDIAVGNNYWVPTTQNGIAILLSNGDGTYKAATHYFSGSTLNDIHAGDLNGDGYTDLAGVDRTTNNLLIILNDGTGAFTNAVNYPVGSVPIGVRIADVNKNGVNDVITANTYGSNISVLLNGGNAALSPANNYPTDGSRQLSVGDLNNDGFVDIAVSNGDPNNVSVLLNNGNGTFAAQTTYATGVYAHYVSIGDLDNNGWNDLVVSNRTANTISVLLNNGDGTFGAQAIYNVGQHPGAIAIGDLNGDGNADIVVANINNDYISVLLNAGNGVFNDQYTIPTGTTPYAVYITDLNSDSKNDIIVSNAGSGNVSVLLNTGTLPVSLVNFTAQIQGNSAKLTWQTATESNNKEFIIYRSADDGNFKEMTRVNGTGNSNSLKTYHHYDENPLNGNNYYKLVQVDNNGKETDLGNRMLNFSLSALRLQLYPNPTDDAVNIAFDNGKYTSLTVMNLNGKVLQRVKIKPTESSLKVSLGNYPTGTYLFQVNGSEGTASGKILKKR